MKRAVLVVFAVLALAGTAQADDVVRFEALATAQTVMSADAGTAVLPGVRLRVDGPVAFGERTPLEIYSILELGGQPGETVDPTQVATFKAAEFTGGLAKVIGDARRGTQHLRTFVFLEGGFATRLPHDPGPAERYPRRLVMGFGVEEMESGARARLGFGDVGAAGPVSWRQVIVAGEAPLKKFGSVDVVLGGDAVITIGKDPFVSGAQRDIFRAFVGARVGG